MARKGLKILGGADRDRTDDLLNAMYFQACHCTYPLLSLAYQNRDLSQTFLYGVCPCLLFLLHIYFTVAVQDSHGFLRKNGCVGSNPAFSTIKLV